MYLLFLILYGSFSSYFLVEDIGMPDATFENFTLEISTNVNNNE